MRDLLLLYWGTAFLMYLSQLYYPADSELRQYGPTTLLHPRADLFMKLVIAWMTCFSFLRTEYNDTTAYINMFHRAISPAQFIAEGQLFDLTGNPLSYFYESVMRSLTGNYHIYFFFPAFLSSYGVIKLFKRYSVSPIISLLIYFSIGTYILYMAALKQCLGFSVLLFSIPYALDKKYIHFYLLVALATLFHTYAFIFAVLPFLCGTPWNKRTWILLGAALFALVTFESTLGAFLNYAQSIGAHAAEEDLFDDNQINILRVAVYLVPALLAFVFRYRLFYNSTREENLFANMSILSGFILMIGLAEGANLMSRMAAYFEIATAITLPWMIKKLFNQESAQIVTVTAVIMYFVYFLYEFSISKDFSTGYSAISMWDFFISLFR